LEADLHTTLFHRHNHGTSLTAKGRVLVTYAEKIFHIVEETKNVMKDDQTSKGPLLIGSMESTAAVRLPPLFFEVHKSISR